MTARAYACKKGKVELFHPTREELTELVAQSGGCFWVDIEGATQEEEKLLVEVFGLHPLLVEDILGEQQPKLEQHEGFVYMIVHGIDPAHREPTDLGTLEMDLLLGSNFVLTHHSGHMRSVEAVRERIEKDPALLTKHPAFLAHAILDHLTDHYLPLMERFDAEIDQLEVQIIKHGQVGGILERIMDLKHGLQRIRRIGIHQKELLSRLSNGSVPAVPKQALPFFRDVYDHFLRVSDLADSYRELVGSTLEAYLSVQSHRLNEVMKVLTLISTIMLPLTFIAGVYGMNFDNMPELSWEYGYPFAGVLMFMTAAALVYYFKRRKWL
jgi:magnesium transporter